MRLVILESPFAGDVEGNVAYARACLRDSLQRGEAPIASHLLYTQPGVLIDDVPEERAQGIAAGLAWRRVAHASVVYVDLGISEGMRHGIKVAQAAGVQVEYRRLFTDEKGAAVDRGGDVTIGDGDYCSECRLADALDCMKVGPCHRRSLARVLKAAGAQVLAA